MRYLFSSFVFVTIGLLAASAIAAPDDNDAKKDDGGARAEMREKILKEFDKDGDGKLSDEERAQAREKMRELMRDRHGDRDGPGEGRPRREGFRGPGGRPGQGPDGRAQGPPKLPKPEELFAKFDKDKDEKLSKEEFMALADYVHEHMPPPPPRPKMGPPGGHFEGHFEGHMEGRFIDGGPDGPRFGEDGPGRRFRGPDGPPPPPRDGERGREFRRHHGPPGDGDFGRRPPKRDKDNAKDKDKDDDEHSDKDKAESAA